MTLQPLLTALMGLLSALAPGLGPPRTAQPAQHAPDPLPAPAPPAPTRRHRKARSTGKRWPGQGDPAVERVRRCILKREAGGDYAAVDPKHRWFGGYQFQRRTSDAAARRMHRPDLIGLTADQWSPEDQDAAFYLIYDRGRGKKHWGGGRLSCF
jgi:hypothetical protein